MNTFGEMSEYIIDESSRLCIAEASDLPTERARNGQPTLTYCGYRLHSAVNPDEEAIDQFEQQASTLLDAVQSGNAEITVVVLGPGLGYIVREIDRVLYEAHAHERAHIICIEADSEVARKALQLRVWQPVKTRVSWMAGSESAKNLSAMASSNCFCVTAAAGYRLNHEYYDTCIQSLSGKPLAERPMRILLPTPLYGGSYPTALHCADAFRALGHHVEVLDFSEYYALFKHAENVTSDPRHSRTLQNMLTTYLAESVVAKALDWRADLVWAVAQSPLTPSALDELKHEGIQTAFWFVEDYRLFLYWKEIAAHYDAIFTIQRNEFHEALKSVGARNIMYLPCAANPSVHRPLLLEPSEMDRYGSPVSFVGAGYYNRQSLFSRMALPGLKIWGNDWPKEWPGASLVQEDGRRVTVEETAKIYCATKVNLNLHSSPNHEGINPHGDFVNPRTFEIASCGAFQIADQRGELADLFVPGDEIAVIRTPEEIPQVIQYYLSHEHERQEMAERARARVLAEHTYVHRMEAALRFCEQRMPRLAQRKRGPNYISTLKTAAADDPEMLAFLSDFPDDTEITLDQIVSRIKVGSGKLSRPEGIFLLMKEFRDWGREKGVIQ